MVRDLRARGLAMSQLDNLKAFDPFADASKGEEDSGQEGVVHIRSGQWIY